MGTCLTQWILTTTENARIQLPKCSPRWLPPGALTWHLQKNSHSQLWEWILVGFRLPLRTIFSGHPEPHRLRFSQRSSCLSLADLLLAMPKIPQRYWPKDLGLGPQRIPCGGRSHPDPCCTLQGTWSGLAWPDTLSQASQQEGHQIGR